MSQRAPVAAERRYIGPVITAVFAQLPYLVAVGAPVSGPVAAEVGEQGGPVSAVGPADSAVGLSGRPGQLGAVPAEQMDCQRRLPGRTARTQRTGELRRAAHRPAIGSSRLTGHSRTRVTEGRTDATWGHSG